jgi:hypothetical protein
MITCSIHSKARIRIEIKRYRIRIRIEIKRYRIRICMMKMCRKKVYKVKKLAGSKPQLLYKNHLILCQLPRHLLD